MTGGNIKQSIGGATNLFNELGITGRKIIVMILTNY